MAQYFSYTPVFVHAGIGQIIMKGAELRAHLVESASNLQSQILMNATRVRADLMKTQMQLTHDANQQAANRQLKRDLQSQQISADIRKLSMQMSHEDSKLSKQLSHDASEKAADRALRREGMELDYQRLNAQEEQFYHKMMADQREADRGRELRLKDGLEKGMGAAGGATMDIAHLVGDETPTATLPPDSPMTTDSAAATSKASSEKQSDLPVQNVLQMDGTTLRIVGNLSESDRTKSTEMYTQRIMQEDHSLALQKQQAELDLVDVTKRARLNRNKLQKISSDSRDKNTLMSTGQASDWDKLQREIDSLKGQAAAARDILNKPYQITPTTAGNWLTQAAVTDTNLETRPAAIREAFEKLPISLQQRMVEQVDFMDMRNGEGSADKKGWRQEIAHAYIRDMDAIYSDISATASNLEIIREQLADNDMAKRRRARGDELSPVLLSESEDDLQRQMRDGVDQLVTQVQARDNLADRLRSLGGTPPVASRENLLAGPWTEGLPEEFVDEFLRESEPEQTRRADPQQVEVVKAKYKLLDEARELYLQRTLAGQDSGQTWSHREWGPQDDDPQSYDDLDDDDITDDSDLMSSQGEGDDDDE